MADRLLPKIRATIDPITTVLCAFAGADASKDEISLEVIFLTLHAYDRLCHDCMPPNMRGVFIDRLVHSFADSYSKTLIDEHRAEARDYFLGKLDERQTYFARAEDLFAGGGPRSAIRMFAEMMNSFFPSMDVVATAGVAKELCLGVRGSLIGPLPTAETSRNAEKTRTMMSVAVWVLAGVTLVLSTRSLRLAGTISALAAAVGLAVGTYGRRASREPDVDPSLAAFEVVFARQFINLGLWTALVSACIWIKLFARGH